MLRLLAQREQGYDDIAALMGLSVDEVRARVDAALAELEREQRPPSPPEPEPPAEPPTPEPEPETPAAPPTPAEPAPPASPPPPVQAATQDAKAPGFKPAGGPRLGIPRDPGARAAIVAGAAALIAIVVVLIVGGGGDDDGGGGDSTSAAAPATGAGAQQTAAGGDAEPTEAILAPVGGGDASGKATFGNLEENLALLVEAEGLKQSGKGQSYAIWLAESPKRMVPVGEIGVGKDGKLSTQVPLPVELLAFIANETFTEVAVTLANSSRLEKSVETATKDEEAPAYTGEVVLRGDVTGPIVGAELPEASSE